MKITETKPRIEKLNKVWAPEAKLIIPHEGKEITFTYPPLGPDAYHEVGRQILDHEMEIFDSDYIASLLHVAYCDDSLKNEPEFKNIKEIMKYNWFWVFNRNLWTSEGVYVVQDEKAIGINQPLYREDLEKILKDGKEIQGIRFSEDKRVRFAPKKSYQLGIQTRRSLVRNGFMIASYGVEGAEKLAEVASKFRGKPHILGLNIQEKQNPEQSVSFLAKDFDDDGFFIEGDESGFDDGGYAFGVSSIQV